jgi:O-antigen/teichoic acid export membrane protein
MSRPPVPAVTGGGAEDAPQPGPLSSILRRGAVISACMLVMMQMISLAGTLLLARLLSPAEVGIYAAATVLNGFLVMFSQSGLRIALIQREHNVENAAETVFWVTAANGVLMSLAALGAAPLIGLMFHSELVGQITAITSGMLLMYALTNVPDGLLQRRLNFKRRLIIDPSRAFAFASVSVALAASGFGVWSLVIGNYVSLAVWLIGVWVLARWRPGRARASIQLWRELARFAYPLLVQNIVEQVREVAGAILVGRGLGATSLGLYRYGRRLALLPGVAVVDIGSYVLLPAFCRLAGDPERLKRGFLRALRWIWFGAAPAAALVIALGEPAVVVLLGERWRGAGVFLVAMSGYGLGIAMHAPSSEVIKGSGRSRLFNWVSAISLPLGIGLILMLLPFGLAGVGLAISVTEIALGVLVLGLAGRVVGCSRGELLRRLVPTGVASLVALAAFLPLEHLGIQSDHRGLVLGLVLLGLETIGFALVYLATLRLVDPSIITDLAGTGRSLLDRWRRGRSPWTSLSEADPAPSPQTITKTDHRK